MGWGLFTEWSDLQFINYSVSEQFDDGTIGAWQLEDWEIYGPGAGGYSSSGPYGDWEADILAWLDNGSLLARDIIDWDASQLQARNLSTHTRESAGVAGIEYYLLGSSFVPFDPNPTFGLAGTGAKYAEGDIVVTAAARHADMSITYRFASVDPSTHQPLTWAENLTFLDMMRADGDVNAIRFDLAEGQPELTPEEQAATTVIRQAMQEMIASLHTLDRSGYFQVEGWGRIPVSELISLIRLTDWKVVDESSFGSPYTVAAANRYEGNPLVAVNRGRLLELAGDPALLFSVLAHEIAHVTRVGWNNATPTYNIDYERRTNDVGRAILMRIGKGAFVFDGLDGGYGSTNIEYRPNLPST